MLGYATLLGLSLVWLFASGFLGSILLRWLPKRLHPQTKLMFWLGGIYSLAVSILTAFLSAGTLIGFSWSGLNQVTAGLDNLGYVVFISILPWVGLAAVSVLVALVISRFQPALAAARQTSELMLQAGRQVEPFHSVPVRVLEVPFLAAVLVDVKRRPEILVSRPVVEQFSTRELDAVYWHELGHAVGEHNGLNRIARVANALLPWLPLTRDVAGAIEELCEQSADRFALKHVDQHDLLNARARFEF